MAPNRAPKNIITAVTKSKTKATGAVSKTAINRQQSLEIVKTMIHGSLSIIFWMRNFLPDKCYENQIYYLNEESVQNYDDFVAGNGSAVPDVSGAETATLRVIRRNRSSRVDGKLFKWLEEGIFPEIERGNLKALEVYVHPSQDRRNVSETYTFTIKYISSAGGGGKVPSGLQINGSDSNASIVGPVGSLIYLFRALGKLCQGMPKLHRNDQEGPFISMGLFYEEKKPPNDHPNFFIQRDEGPAFFAAAESWETRTELIQNLRCGYQTAELQINYLAPSSLGFHSDTIHGADDLTIPGHVDFSEARDPSACGDKIRRWDNSIKARSPPETRIEPADSNHESDLSGDLKDPPGFAQAPDADDLPSPPFFDANDLRNPQLSGSPVSDHQKLGNEPKGRRSSIALPPGRTTDPMDSLNTQSSNASRMRSSARKMFQSENMTQGDTQACNIGSESRTSVSELGIESETQDEDTVRCQCGSKEKDDDTITCSSCGNLQHQHCYGYRGASDARLPTDHTCYQCLLGQNEVGRLQRLQRLVIKRRGVHMAENHGLTNQDAFVKEMRQGKKPEISTAAAREVYKHLKTEGYVVSSSDSQKRVKLAAVQSGPHFEKMLKELFDPSVEISYHDFMPATYNSKNNTLTQNSFTSPSAMMPPPTTPASRNRREPSTSSRTDLDRPTGWQPDRTPSRPANFGTRGRKRSREEDIAAGDSPKRRSVVAQRLPNSQSGLLDMGNLSSPAPESPFGSTASRY